MILINAFKEQQSQIEEQNALNTKQSAEIDALRASFAGITAGPHSARQVIDRERKEDVKIIKRGRRREFCRHAMVWGIGELRMVITMPTCDWIGCQIVARFHIEVPNQSNGKLSGESSVRLPFSRAHYNVCAAHLDEYSSLKAPAAIYHVGKCPHCGTA